MIFLAPLAGLECLQARLGIVGMVDGSQRRYNRLPVLVGNELRRVPDQVDDTGLDNRLGKTAAMASGKTFRPLSYLSVTRLIQGSAMRPDDTRAGDRLRITMSSIVRRRSGLISFIVISCLKVSRTVHSSKSGALNAIRAPNAAAAASFLPQSDSAFNGHAGAFKVR